MNLRNTLKTKIWGFFTQWDRVMTISLIVFLFALFLPANPDLMAPAAPAEPWIDWVEEKGRFVNTALQIGLPVVTRDIVGLKSLVWIALAGTTSTHGLKRTLDSVEIRNVRLGERPSSDESSYNFPSGHSSLASSGAVFVSRRYGWHWALLLVPITLAVMYVRYRLDAHTFSAVIGGASLGILFTWPFSKPK